MSTRHKIEQSSWFAVVDAYEKCARLYAQMLDEFGLSVAQYDALSVIRGLGDHATPRAIAERLLVTRGNVTGMLKRLQDNGLITTEKSTVDARSFSCHLTSIARSRLALADRAARDFVGQQLAPFNNTALRTLQRDMQRMSAHLDTMQPGAIAKTAKEATSS